ncbi:hypothetical protein ABPG72_022746 [Tetrahymena utriculariae]
MNNIDKENLSLVKIQNTEEIKQDNVVTQSGLKVLHTFSEIMKSENEQSNIKQILIQEKLIYCGLYCIEDGNMKEIGFSLKSEITDFVERVNKYNMNQIQLNKFTDDSKVILKAVDILFNKQISKIFKQYQPLNRLRVLTFNNLSYIYRELGKFQETLKAVNYAISLEERLAEENYDNCQKDIITSYLNKSAILSELNRHDKALQSVEKALSAIKRYESKAKTEQEKAQINYLSMVSYFNLANESEVLGLRNQCLDYYEQSAIYAKKVNNITMINRINQILESIVEKNKNKKKNSQIIINQKLY